MTASVGVLSSRVRNLIKVTEDEHWIWTGAFTRSAARLGNLLVKPLIWQGVTGDQLRPSERVYRDCEERRCVNPDHQHVGDVSEGNQRLAALVQVGVPKTRWAE